MLDEIATQRLSEEGGMTPRLGRPPCAGSERETLAAPRSDAPWSTARDRQNQAHRAARPVCERARRPCGPDRRCGRPEQERRGIGTGATGASKSSAEPAKPSSDDAQSAAMPSRPDPAQVVAATVAAAALTVPAQAPTPAPAPGRPTAPTSRRPPAAHPLPRFQPGRPWPPPRDRRRRRRPAAAPRPPPWPPAPRPVAAGSPAPAGRRRRRRPPLPSPQTTPREQRTRRRATCRRRSRLPPRDAANRAAPADDTTSTPQTAQAPSRLGTSRLRQPWRSRRGPQRRPAPAFTAASAAPTDTPADSSPRTSRRPALPADAASAVQSARPRRRRRADPRPSQLAVTVALAGDIRPRRPQSPSPPALAPQSTQATQAAPTSSALPTRFGVSLHEAVEPVRSTIELGSRQGVSQARIELSPPSLGGDPHPVAQHGRRTDRAGAHRQLHHRRHALARRRRSPPSAPVSRRQPASPRRRDARRRRCHRPRTHPGSTPHHTRGGDRGSTVTGRARPSGARNPGMPGGALVNVLA